MASGENLRDAMRKFPTGVSVITVVKDDGAVASMTANSITSISLSPPLVLVCVGFSRNTLVSIEDSGKFAINILREGDEHIARHFASEEKERVEQLPVEYEFNYRGTPKLKNGLSFIDCEVVGTHVYGDHVIFVGEVHAAQVEEGKPLVFFEGQYLGLEKDKR